MTTQTKEDRRIIDVPVGMIHQGVIYKTDFREDFQGSVVDVLRRIKEAVEENVPEEFRHTATLYHTTEPEGFGDGEYQRTYMTYQRPETDEEMQLRHTIEEERRELAEAMEREQLRRLQAKYEGK